MGAVFTVVDRGGDAASCQWQGQPEGALALERGRHWYQACPAGIAVTEVALYIARENPLSKPWQLCPAASIHGQDWPLAAGRLTMACKHGGRPVGWAVMDSSLVAGRSWIGRGMLVGRLPALN